MKIETNSGTIYNVKISEETKNGENFKIFLINEAGSNEFFKWILPLKSIPEKYKIQFILKRLTDFIEYLEWYLCDYLSDDEYAEATAESWLRQYRLENV